MQPWPAVRHRPVTSKSVERDWLDGIDVRYRSVMPRWRLIVGDTQTLAVRLCRFVACIIVFPLTAAVRIVVRFPTLAKFHRRVRRFSGIRAVQNFESGPVFPNMRSPGLRAGHSHFLACCAGLIEVGP